MNKSKTYNQDMNISKMYIFHDMMKTNVSSERDKKNPSNTV